MAHRKALLLGIPVELRWEIILEVLLETERPAPHGPSETRFEDCCSIDRRTIDRGRRRWQAEARRVWFESKPFPNPAISLLLTNRQLRDETLEVLHSKRFLSTPVRCRLDIIYINNASLSSSPLHDLFMSPLSS